MTNIKINSHRFDETGFCLLCGCFNSVSDYTYTEECIDPSDFYYDYDDSKDDMPNTSVLTEKEEDELPF